ncbi:MAG: hypothetical protein WED34_19010 [Planctomycetales bacterium]
MQLSRYDRLRERVLQSLNELFGAVVGDARGIAADVRIDHWMKQRRIWDAFDFVDLVFGVESAFGVSIPQAEWDRFFGCDAAGPEEWEQNVGPPFTFGALADLVLAHSAPQEIRPLRVAGRECLAAGVFRGIEQIVRQLRPDAARFAPSTPLHERLECSELRRLLVRLEWATDACTPRTRSRWSEWLDRWVVMSAVVTVGSTVCTIVMRQWQWLFLPLIDVFVVRGFLRARERTESPFASEIRTYGDLARAMSHSSCNTCQR